MIYNKITGTTPVIVHAPGAKPVPLFNSIKQHILINGRRKSEVAPLLDTQIFTWNTRKVPGLFELSLNRLNYKCTVLKDSNWGNYKKITTILNVIDSIKEKYIFCSDSFDVICLSSISHLHTVLGDKRMLISTECSFNPKTQFTVDEYHFENSLNNGKWRYLNAGLYFGEREFCKEFLLTCMKYFKIKPPSHSSYIANSDQLLFHKAFKQMHQDIKLDYNCEIFQSLTQSTFNEIFPLKAF